MNRVRQTGQMYDLLDKVKTEITETTIFILSKSKTIIMSGFASRRTNK